MAPIDLSAVPDGIPVYVWGAALDLYSQIDEINGHEMNDAQVAQDSDEGKFTWCRMVAEIITSHISTHRRMIEGTVKP